MRQTLILLPVLMQVILTFATLVILGVRRHAAYKAGNVDAKKALLDATAWPKDVLKVTNNFNNQFETPVLFYVLCFSLLALDGVTGTVLVFAWVYVASRYVHTYIHIGSNYVPYRFAAFATGCLMLLCMTALAIWHILSPYLASHM